jgi:hypothetical protein
MDVGPDAGVHVVANVHSVRLEGTFVEPAFHAGMIGVLISVEDAVAAQIEGHHVAVGMENAIEIKIRVLDHLRARGALGGG